MAAYATAEDLERLGIPDRALESVATEEREAALEAASRLADGYLAAQFTLPLSAWGDDLRDAVVAIAIYRVMVRRGYDPDGGGNTEIRRRYEDAIAWLERIASGKVHPAVTDATPDVDDAAPVVISPPRRGW